MKQRGFSILETSLSLAILSIVLASLGGIFAKMVREYSAVQKASNQALAYQRIIEIAQDVIRNYDSYPFPLSPRVHLGGRISFFDGTSNPVMIGPSNRKPLVESDAFTSIRMDLTVAIRISQIRVGDSSFTIEGCQRYKTRFDNESYHSYLLFGPVGIFELAALSHTSRGQSENGKNCHSIMLGREKSMITPYPATNSILLSRFIIPVSDLFTIYVDQTNSLRYLSHAASRNIENQPIADGAPPLKVKIKHNLDRRLLGIEISSIQNLGSQFPRISLVNHLARSSILSFLLNRP